MKIIHFAVDDKFIPFVQKTFDQAFPGANEYRIPKNGLKPLQFVIPGSNVQVVDDNYWSSNEIEEDLKQFDCLLIHYMNPLFIKGISKAHPELLTMWVGWGGDYYHLIEPYFRNLILTDTNDLVSSLQMRIRYALDKWVRRTKKSLLAPGKAFAILKNKVITDNSPLGGIDLAVQDIAEKIDLLWVNPEEVPFIEKALPSFKGDYHRICYYSAEETFAIGPDRMDGPDLLIGNSATATNNHLELFDLLMKIDIGDGKLILPLSYGDKVYGDEITRIAKRKFGTRIMAIRDYMPLEEYYSVIKSCGTVLMNHVRQQAGTTVATALYKGAKVYLRNENPVLSYYRAMGISVYSLQDELLSTQRPFGPIDDTEIENNREILNSYWGHKAAVNAALELKNHLINKRSKNA